MADVGGLVIAPSIDIAEHMADLLENLGERPFVVHNQVGNAEDKIKAFRKGNRWLVSVGMVSEGVDIHDFESWFICLMPKPSSLSGRQWDVSLGIMGRMTALEHM